MIERKHGSEFSAGLRNVVHVQQQRNWDVVGATMDLRKGGNIFMPQGNQWY
jgi:hypothetical protein